MGTTDARRLAPGIALAIALPALLTGVLGLVGATQARDLIFLYLALVAALGVTTGVAAAVIAAAVSFGLIDFFLVPPYHAFTIANEQDQVDLAVLVVTALLVGTLGSRRRRAQLRAEALAAELREANKAQQQVRILEESERLRRELLANVSHELRTPLGSILMGSTALAARETLPAGDRAEAASIAAEARRLNRLVGDMLDMARIEGHALSLEIEPQSLDDAVGAAVRRLRRLSSGRRVSVRIDDAVSVLADWNRLAQILDNLLANADRFSPPGTPITVAAASGPDTVTVTIRDQGPGIPAELRDHIFERFVHGEVRDGRGGTGLGLAIVRGLVEAQGGTVRLEAATTPGTAITFTLPAAEATSGGGTPPDDAQLGSGQDFEPAGSVESDVSGGNRETVVAEESAAPLHDQGDAVVVVADDGQHTSTASVLPADGASHQVRMARRGTHPTQP